jgi:hypothetical protein
MPFLEVGAVTMEVTALSEAEPLVVGDRYETFNGTERSSISAYKRRWQGVTRPLTPAEFTTYRAALVALSFTASGDALGTSLTCSATITGADYVRDRASHLRIIEFELRER